MIITIIVACTIAVLLVLLWQLTRASTTSDDPTRFWETSGPRANLDAFRLLVDPDEEIYLRKSVPKREFRKLQRKRVALALRCVHMMASSASLSMRLATLARQAENHEVVIAGDQLMYLSLQVRMNAFVAEFYLIVKWIFPSWTINVPMSLERYQRLLKNCDWILSRPQQLPQHIQTVG